MTRASGSVYDYTTPHKERRAEVEVGIGGGRGGEREGPTKTEQGNSKELLEVNKDLLKVHKLSVTL